MMRNMLIALAMLVSPMTSAHAQVSVAVAVPGISIGINVPAYPEFARVPGYPVYYAPRLHSNYFFYDGLYWAYQGDNWYVSSWYDGPWQFVEPESVPLFVLRIPVRYYRQRPAYFRGWSRDAPPRWGEHWGRDWERRRSGWDRWDRRSAPPAAPLPVYQRQYSGERYPRAPEQQHSIQSEKYRYHPREAVTRQYSQPQGSPRADPQHPAPVRQTQPSRPMHEVQPVRATPQVQSPRAAPRGKGGAEKAAPRGEGRKDKAAPQQRAAPQDNDRDKASPSKKGAPHEEGRGNQEGNEKGGRGQERN